MPDEPRPSAFIRWSKPLALAIGALLIWLGQWVLDEHSWYGRLLFAVGEAFFVAGLLAYVVDSVLKTSLVRDVADLAMRYLWGMKAPQNYVVALRDSLGKIDRYNVSLRIEVEFEWHQRDSVLAVACTTRTHKKNISSSYLETSLPWVQRSTTGAPRSQITYLELAVRKPNLAETGESPYEEGWAEYQLHAYEVVAPDGGIGLDSARFIADYGIPSIDPGGESEARCEGKTYRRCPGQQILISACPSLAVQIRIKGGALADIDVCAHVGAEEKILRRKGDRVEAEHGFTNSGEAIWLEWQPKEVAVSDSKPDVDVNVVETL